MSKRQFSAPGIFETIPFDNRKNQSRFWWKSTKAAKLTKTGLLLLDSTQVILQSWQLNHLDEAQSSWYVDAVTGMMVNEKKTKILFKSLI